jgi:hypothetical protein
MTLPTKGVTLPLTDDLRAAYKALYDQYESLIEATTDPGLLGVLDSSQTDVDNILTKDSMYRLHANTALYQALMQQIKSTNNDLAALKKQIQTVASHVAEAGDAIAAITKVLSLVSG